MTDVIEQRLRAAALGTPADPPPLSTLRRRAARRRAGTVVAGLAALAVVATGVAVLQPLQRTSAAEVARTVEQGGVRLEVRVADADVEVGDELVVEVTVSNTGDRPVRYANVFCGLGVRARLDTGLQSTGREWDGPAKTFQELVLAYRRFDPGVSFGDGRPCGEGRIDEAVLEPGDTLTATARTTVTLAGGRADGTGQLDVRFLDTTDKAAPAELLATLRLRVTGESDRPGPYEVVDAALSDPAFAAFLAEHPDSSTWAPVIAGLIGDRWTVGLDPRMRNGTAVVSGLVYVDARTGEVVQRDLP